MPRAARPNPSSAPSDPASSPRPGPAQLLIWTAGIGAYLALAGIPTRQSPGWPGWLLLLSLALGVGSAWAGAGWLAWQALGRRRWSGQPGHWLLVLTAAVTALEVLLRSIPPAVFARPEWVLRAASCWLLVLPLFDRGTEVRWKTLFVMWMILDAAPLVWGCGWMLSAQQTSPQPATHAAITLVREPVVLGSLLTTCWLDHRAGHRRDWLHGCGVATVVWLALLRMGVLPAAGRP